MNYQEECSIPDFYSEKDEVKKVLDSIVVKKTDESIYLVAVVFDKENPNKNVAKMIVCDGEPIQPCAYDVGSDCFYYNCFFYMHIGKVPVAYVIENNNNCYHINVPEDVFVKYLCNSQYEKFVRFKEEYGDKDKFSIIYLQSIA